VLWCRNGGIDTEKDYKYKAQDGVCNIAKEKRHVVTIDSYEDVPPNDESALKKVCFPLHISPMKSVLCWPLPRHAEGRLACCLCLLFSSIWCIHKHCEHLPQYVSPAQWGIFEKSACMHVLCIHVH
jgi:hypothetical protein